MTISTRNMLILKFLMENNNSSIKDIMDYFKISESSIRYDLKNINYFLQKENIGSILFLAKGLLYYKGKTFEFNNLNNKWQYLLTKEERINYLKLYIFLYGKKFNMKNFIEELGISRNTLKSDLIEIDDFIGEADENKNLFILNNIIKNIINENNPKYFHSKYIIEHLFYIVDIFGIKKIINFTKNILKQLDKKISDESFSLIVTCLILTIENIDLKKNKYFKLNNMSFFKNTKEFKILEKNIYILEQNFDIKIPLKELIFLTNYFIGAQTYNNINDFYENWIDIDIFLKKILKEIDISGNFLFSKDNDLYLGLLKHLKPTLYRVHNNMQLHSSIFLELEEKDMPLFDLIKKNLLKFKDFKNICNDEITYILIYFKQSLQRDIIKNINKKKKILIICNFGYGTSQILSENLKENYNIDIVDIIPIYELDSYSDLTSVDFIISTQKININLKNTPIIIVSPLLNKKDIKILDQYNLIRKKERISLVQLLKFIENEKKFPTTQNNIIKNIKKTFNDFIYDDVLKKFKIEFSDLCPRDFFIINKNRSNWKTLLYELGNRMVSKKIFTYSYIEEMIEIVYMKGPYMVIDQFYGIFHGSNVKVNKTSIGILISEEPIYIKNKKVNILIILASKDGKEHLPYLIELTNFLNSKEQIQKLLNISDCNEKYNFIKF